MAIKPGGDEPHKWSLLNNKICQDSPEPGLTPALSEQRSQVLRGGGMAASDWSARHQYSPLIGCWETQCTGSGWGESWETWVTQTQAVQARAGWYRVSLASDWPHRSQSWPLIGWWGHGSLWSDTDTRLRFRPLTAWGAGQIRGVHTILIRRVSCYQLNPSTTTHTPAL